MKHGIVIPCYNESSRLKLETFIDFARAHKSTSLCFVNDGSSDPTRSTLAEIKNLVQDNVFIFNVAENAGKANAVRQGSLFLYKETEVETIGFLDADLSTSFQDYGDLITEMEGAQDLKIVFGSRNMADGEDTIERNPIRKILSETIRKLIFLITRLNIKDTQCGAKVFHRSLIPLIYKTGFFSKWLFDVEILLRLKKAIGVLKFREIFKEKALAQWVHMEGSKLNFKDSIMIPLNLLAIWKNYEWKPMIQSIKEKLRFPRSLYNYKWVMKKS